MRDAIFSTLLLIFLTWVVTESSTYIFECKKERRK